MLVLSRQRDESVMIGDDVEVRVVDVRGDKVRLGFIAPREVSVHRKEVYDQIRRENRDAAQVMPDDLRGLRPPPASPKMRLVPDALPTTDDPFLRAAIEEARAALSDGGLPIGAVLVRDGKVIARGCDSRIQNGDPTAHAEVECLRKTGRERSYADTVLYCTSTPRLLGSGAVVQVGIRRVVVGASVNAPGGSGPALLRGHGVDVVELDDRECVELTSIYIRENPDRWTDARGG